MPLTEVAAAEREKLAAKVEKWLFFRTRVAADLGSSAPIQPSLTTEKLHQKFETAKGPSRQIPTVQV